MIILFYCHHWCGDEYIEDPEGGEFKDLEAARAEAIVGARCILSGEIRAGRVNLNQRFELHDGTGNHLLTLPFDEAVEIDLPQTGRQAAMPSAARG